jgi:hypothetical protein
VFETMAVVGTLVLMIVFGVLIRMEYVGRQEDKADGRS